MLPEEQHVAEHKAELLMLEAQTKGGNQARAARHTLTQVAN